MHKIRKFIEAEEILKTYVPPAREYRQAVLSLDNMKSLMHKLGDPQDKFQVIHVAGSSGKTSTSYYIAAILSASGKKVGLTVSPHIDNLNERVQINLVPLPEEIFCNQLSEFIEIIDELEERPTYFELMVAFAYWQFAKQKVDYAVIEVGIGGMLDATNVINRTDKVCVITDIGMDHTGILGYTLPEIAKQKAGIIKSRNIVFAYDQGYGITNVLKESATQASAKLVLVSPQTKPILPIDLPKFQQRNLGLAYIVAQFIYQRYNLPQLSDSQLHKTAQIYIPARMETNRCGDKIVIMDGAHNPQKMGALVQSIEMKYTNNKTAVIVALIASKKPRIIGTLHEVYKISSHIIFTSFVTQQDAKKQSVDPHKLAQYSSEAGFKNFEVESDPKIAYTKLLGRPEKILLITGSFYLLNHIRPVVFKSDTNNSGS